jgi:hypothetical protein
VSENDKNDTAARLKTLASADKRAAEAADDARAAFHAEVLAADDLGWTVAAIATAAERPASTVQGIVSRR